MAPRFNPHVLPLRPGEKEDHIFVLAGSVLIAAIAVVVGIIYLANNPIKVQVVGNGPEVAPTTITLTLAEAQLKEEQLAESAKVGTVTLTKAEQKLKEAQLKASSGQ